MNHNPLSSQSISFKSLRNGASKAQIKAYFIHTYERYEALFDFIKDDSSYYTKPEPLRHPLIFYFGHTATFYINKMIDRGLISQRVNPKFETMFAVGVDEMDWDDLDETHYEWASVSQVRQYRSQVKNVVIEYIQNMNPQLSWDSEGWVILMGIQHEQIHFETSAVIIRRLPISQIVASKIFQDCPYQNMNQESRSENQLKKVEIQQLQWNRGEKQKSDYYGWDNQFGTKKIKTHPFSAATMLVSNQEFLQFVKDDAYSKPWYWDQEGKAWLKSTKTNYPIFWVKDQNNFKLRTLNYEIDMPLDWPVEVNNLEATAFCNWKGAKIGKKIRLPTEDQYYQIRQYLDKDHFEWQSGQIGNINAQNWFSPCPVNYFQHKGFYDIIGNVWQHCSTPMYPFQNFQIHPIYEDFTTPTFDGRHYMIKGGSFISCGNQSFKYSRYAFRRHFYQFAGFRYIESEFDPQFPTILKDENDEKVHESIRIHYICNSSYITRALALLKEKYCFENDKFLHVGCSVGRIVLEMSKHFKFSFGTDFSARFFQIATRMLERGELKYQSETINREAIGPTPQKIVLYQMNPQNLDSNKVNGFKVVLVDGLSIKDNTIKKVIENCINLMVGKSYLLICNSEQKNNFNSQQVNNSAQLLERVEINKENSGVGSDVIIRVFGINK